MYTIKILLQGLAAIWILMLAAQALYGYYSKLQRFHVLNELKARELFFFLLFLFLLLFIASTLGSCLEVASFEGMFPSENT